MAARSRTAGRAGRAAVTVAAVAALGACSLVGQGDDGPSPAASGDPEAAGGGTVVLVTHEARVAAYSDREVVVRDGKVRTPAQVR